jgi:hypothetical protein
MTLVDHHIDRAHRADPRVHSPGRINGIALGWSLSIFLAATLLLCVVGGYILPSFMTHFLAAVFPQYDWRSPPVVAVAAMAAFVFGWYAAFIVGPLYNLFHPKG